MISFGPLMLIDYRRPRAAGGRVLETPQCSCGFKGTCGWCRGRYEPPPEDSIPFQFDERPAEDPEHTHSPATIGRAMVLAGLPFLSTPGPAAVGRDPRQSRSYP